MAQPRKLQAIITNLDLRPTVIRPELNLEQWSLWQPASTRGQELKTKVLEKEIQLPNGTPVRARVTVDFTSLGVLNTDDQKTLYALIKIWEEKGEEFFRQTYISVNQLLKTLKRTRGRDSRNAIIQSLRRLRKNQIDWELSYIDSETGERVQTFEDPFTIIAELKIVHREKGGKPIRDEGYFKFHPLILKNLAANYRKPVLFDVVISFKSDIAQLIYTQLDRILSNTNRYERRTKELFNDLGIDGKEYKYQSARKRTLERATTELIGKPLSKGGVISQARIVPTVDQSDYKVIFEKGAIAKKSPLPPAPQEDSAFVKRLRDELGIPLERARDIEQHHKHRAVEVLESRIYFHEYQTLKTGFWITAITKPEEIELPILYTRAKAKHAEVENATQKRKREEAEAKHIKMYHDAYAEYFNQRIAAIRAEYPDEWRHFEEATAEERAKTERLLSAESNVTKLMYQAMVIDHFQYHKQCAVLDFDQWDKEHNNQPFKWPQ